MKKLASGIISISILLIACQTALEKYGATYQKTKDIESLKMIVQEMPADVDTGFVKKILGAPIDMGFDYRYLTNLTGENGCIIGAVFHIDATGKIDDKWVGEICE